MNSRELNKAIEQTLKQKEYLLPFLGWFWRYVDFDLPYYFLSATIKKGKVTGVFIDAKGDLSNSHFYVKCEPHQWQDIKTAFEKFVNSPSDDTAKNVYQIVQNCFKCNIYRMYMTMQYYTVLYMFQLNTHLAYRKRLAG